MMSCPLPICSMNFFKMILASWLPHNSVQFGSYDITFSRFLLLALSNAFSDSFCTPEWITHFWSSLRSLSMWDFPLSCFIHKCFSVGFLFAPLGTGTCNFHGVTFMISCYILHFVLWGLVHHNFTALSYHLSVSSLFGNFEDLQQHKFWFRL
jgi:hypothetical protein